MEKCAACNGDGWYADHSDAHYTYPDDGCVGCPVQRQCENCDGTGQIREGMKIQNGSDGRAGN